MSTMILPVMSVMTIKEWLIQDLVYQENEPPANYFLTFTVMLIRMKCKYIFLLNFGAAPMTVSIIMI